MNRTHHLVAAVLLMAGTAACGQSPPHLQPASPTLATQEASEATVSATPTTQQAAVATTTAATDLPDDSIPSDYLPVTMPEPTDSLDVQVLYSEPFNSGGTSLGLDLELNDGMPTGPAGFGVDAAGSIYLMDALAHRVIIQSHDGVRSEIAFPDELLDAVITSFDVAPDGTMYVGTLDGVTAVANGHVIRAYSGTELGLPGATMQLEATAEGLYVPSAGGWTRVTDSAGEVLSPQDRSPRENPGDPDLHVRASGTTLEVGWPGAAFSLDRADRTGVVILATTLNDRSAALLVISERDSPKLRLVTITRDGAVASTRVGIHPEGMLVEGLYLRERNGALYIETGSETTAEILRIDVAARVL